MGAFRLFTFSTVEMAKLPRSVLGVLDLFIGVLSGVFAITLVRIGVALLERGFMAEYVGKYELRSCEFERLFSMPLLGLVDCVVRRIGWAIRLALQKNKDNLGMG